MTDDKVKIAFQDGLRTAIKILETAKAETYQNPTLRGHKELTGVTRTLRDLIDRDLPVPEISYEARLYCVVDTIEAIVDHAREGGSFRHLIYHRLGFDLDAYTPLYLAGGMTISNEFCIVDADPGDEELSSRLLKELWPKKGSTTVEIIGGREPWVTICESAARICALSVALQAEQEKRRRIEAELGPHVENVGPDGYHAPVSRI